jgi:hypothetical protein
MWGWPGKLALVEVFMSQAWGGVKREGEVAAQKLIQRTGRAIVGVAGAVVGAGEGADDCPEDGLGAGLCQGFKVWGKLARPVDSGAVGKNKGPFCPHALSTAAPPTRTCSMTKIFITFNILRL